jgi:hypothetical protein
MTTLKYFKKMITLMPVLILPLLSVSCNTTEVESVSTINQSETSEVSSGGFLPGEIMAGLPVYPDSTPTTYLEFESGPPSSPVSRPLYAGPSRPGYQSASAQYTVKADMDSILEWYEKELGQSGYQKSNESGWGRDYITGRNMAFFLPSQPLVSVEIHVYNINGVSSPVFELLAIYNVPLPKPDKEALPTDIVSAEVIWFGYSDSTRPEIKTITDKQDVMQLVDMVNSLPVRPDYVILGQPGGPETVFRLVFDSVSEGDITVTSILGGDNTGINVDDYPILWDTHNLLREMVKQIMGVQDGVAES